MQRLFAFLFLFTLVVTGSPAVALANPGPDPATSVRITPPPPQFSDAERQAELARRRAAVAAKMTDKSMLIMFSTEPKLYTNDVDYVYRQENNLYYLTNLKQDNATDSSSCWSW